MKNFAALVSLLGWAWEASAASLLWGPYYEVGPTRNTYILRSETTLQLPGRLPSPSGTKLFIWAGHPTDQNDRYQNVLSREGGNPCHAGPLGWCVYSRSFRKTDPGSRVTVSRPQAGLSIRFTLEYNPRTGITTQSIWTTTNPPTMLSRMENNVGRPTTFRVTVECQGNCNGIDLDHHEWVNTHIQLAGPDASFGGTANLGLAMVSQTPQTLDGGSLWYLPVIAMPQTRIGQSKGAIIFESLKSKADPKVFAPANPQWNSVFGGPGKGVGAQVQQQPAAQLPALQQPAKGGLFGGNTIQPQALQGQGKAFPAQAGPQGFGSLFGGQQQQQQQQQPAKPASGLGSLFGGQQQQQQPAKPASGLGSLFGGQQQQQQPAKPASGLGSLFGGQQQQQQPAKPASGLGSLFGGQQQQQQPAKPASGFGNLLGGVSAPGGALVPIQQPAAAAPSSSKDAGQSVLPPAWQQGKGS